MAETQTSRTVPVIMKSGPHKRWLAEAIFPQLRSILRLAPCSTSRDRKEPIKVVIGARGLKREKISKNASKYLLSIGQEVGSIVAKERMECPV